MMVVLGICVFGTSFLEQIMRRVPDLNKEQTLRLWHDMLEHGDGHHEGEEEGEEVEDRVQLQRSLQLHLFHLHLGAVSEKIHLRAMS